MTYGKLMWASAIAMAVASMPAMAGAPSLEAYEVSKIGAVQYPQAQYGTWGLMTPFTTINKSSSGQGLAFAGPTQVESVTISQFTDEYNRRLIKTFEVYANGTPVGTVTLDPTRDEQTLPILDYDGNPIVVTATWLTLMLREQYPSMPGATDSLSSVGSLHVNGTPCAPGSVETNLNSGLQGAATTYITNYGKLPCVTDGDLRCHGNETALFYTTTETGFTWQNKVTDGDGNPVYSFTVSYMNDPDNLPTIGSVGLSFLANFACRSVPKWVILSDSSGNELKVFVDEEVPQYNRYDQGYRFDENGEIVGEAVWFDSLFVDTESLTLTFPTWGTNDTDNWWVGDIYFGLAEFQAFADRVPAYDVKAVPEPATLTLLALGGLALLRRRK